MNATISVYRHMTSDDAERLEAAERRFAARHGLEFGFVDMQVMDDARLARLWLACQRRAVREPAADVFSMGVIGRRA